MTILDTLSRLRDSSGPKATEATLKSIPASSEFWQAAHHGLQPLASYPIRFTLRDPIQYGEGVPEGVFPKILTGMFSGALDEISLVRALTAFSHRCTEEEWKEWYKPVLEHRLRLPLTLTQFNKHCPPEYRVTGNPSLAQIERIEETKGLPSQFVLEAHTGSQRLLVLLRTDRTLVFLEDGTPVHRMLPNVLNRFSTDEGVVLELVEADEGLYARDVLLWDQFRKESPCPPVEVRLNVLERMLAGQDAVSMVEYILHENTDGVRDDIALFFESGYEGVIFRPLGITYFADHSNILVNPKRRSVLTCTQITEGTGKYAGRAEYVHGRGTMNRKKFETPVFHGLTFSTRESILRGIDDYTGRKFVVRSCGLGEDGMLLFPVFQEWKEDTK